MPIDINSLRTKSSYGLKKSSSKDVFDSVGFKEAIDILYDAKACYEKLEPLREERRRSGRYLFGKHWSDLIMDPDNMNRMITEEEHIKSRGKVPLVHNMIHQIVVSVIGQFRSSETEGIVTVRDSEESSLGEMVSIALQYVNQLNQKWQLDSEALLEMLVSGVAFQKIKYDIIPTKGTYDGYLENVNTARMFWNIDMEDSRGWDVKMIGQVHDLSISDILAAFSNGSRKRAIELRELYKLQGTVKSARFDKYDFLTPYDGRSCRVLEIWTKESKEQLYCIDYLTGDTIWMDVDKEQSILRENARRIMEYQKKGIAEEDALLITYTWKIRQYFYYRFMSPSGHVIKEGMTPYWHGSHPYEFKFHNRFDGKPHSFVADLIDENRLINRMLTQHDFTMATNAKNTLFVDKSALGGMSPEQLGDDYSKVGSVIALDPGAGKSIKDIYSIAENSASNDGTSEVVARSLQFMDSISGVHSAQRGGEAKAGTAAALYAQQVQQSAINLVDLFETFKGLREATDMKMIQIIQQYYTQKRFINIAGANYSKEARWYDPDKVRDAQFDYAITQSTSTASYRAMADNFLMDLWKEKAINVKMLLENISLPFADKILQAIETQEKEMQQQGQQEGQLQQQMPQQ